MNATLRPMNLGEILDRTFEIYRKRFWVFVGLAAMPAITKNAILLLFFLLGTKAAKAIVPVAIMMLIHRIGLWLSPPVVITFLLSLTWPVFVSIASSQLQGCEKSLMGAVSQCAARREYWVQLAVVLWVVCSVAPAVIGSIFAKGAGVLLGSGRASSANLRFASLGPVPFVIFQILPVLVGSVAVALSVPAWLVERLRLGAALRRGWDFARNDLLRISSSWMIPAVLSGALSSLVGFLFHIFSPAGGFGASRWAVFNTYLVSTDLISVLTSPIFPIATTLIYYDQRIRREGYDIEKMMEAAGLGEVGAASGGAASIEAEPQETEA